MLKQMTRTDGHVVTSQVMLKCWEAQETDDPRVHDNETDPKSRRLEQSKWKQPRCTMKLFLSISRCASKDEMMFFAFSSIANLSLRVKSLCLRTSKPLVLKVKAIRCLSHMLIFSQASFPPRNHATQAVA